MMSQIIDRYCYKSKLHLLLPKVYDKKAFHIQTDSSVQKKCTNKMLQKQNKKKKEGLQTTKIKQLAFSDHARGAAICCFLILSPGFTMLVKKNNKLLSQKLTTISFLTVLKYITKMPKINKRQSQLIFFHKTLLYCHFRCQTGAPPAERGSNMVAHPKWDQWHDHATSTGVCMIL